LDIAASGDGRSPVSRQSRAQSFLKTAIDLFCAESQFPAFAWHREPHRAGFHSFQADVAHFIAPLQLGVFAVVILPREEEPQDLRAVRIGFLLSAFHRPNKLISD